MAKSRNRIVDFLAYAAVRAVVAAFQILPLSSGVAFAKLLARIAYAVDRRHRQVAEDNLQHAFGAALTAGQRRRLVLGVYEHFLTVAAEMARIPRTLRISNFKRKVRQVNVAPLLRAALDDTRPTIVVTGHFGNWEMAGFVLAAAGARSYAIARTLDNPHLDRFVKEFREYTGQTVLSKNDDFDRIEQALADKQVLVSVADQSAGPRGLFVDFFGRPASTHKAVALLARAHDAPVALGFGIRRGPNLRYDIVGGGVFDPRDYEDRRQGDFDFTRDFTKALEDAVRQAPEQYLWLHHRWKHQPPAPRRRAA